MRRRRVGRRGERAHLHDPYRVGEDGRDGTYTREKIKKKVISGARPARGQTIKRSANSLRRNRADIGRPSRAGRARLRSRGA